MILQTLRQAARNQALLTAGRRNVSRTFPLKGSGSAQTPSSDEILKKFAEGFEKWSEAGYKNIPPIEPWTLFKAVGLPIMTIFGAGIGGGFWLVTSSVKDQNK